MRSLAQRSHEPEWMDGAEVSPEDYAACIRDLARVNTLTLARRPTLAFIDRLLDAAPAGSVPTIVDVGFGAGDMLRAIARRLARRGRRARLIGYDINPRSAPVAERLTDPESGIAFRTGDAFAWPAGEPLDAVVSSLVTHHMADAEIVRFLRWMEARARLGWLVNDLHRHWFSYHGFRALAGAMRWHPFVRHDGPLSIARSFRRGDWDRLLSQAGLGGAAEVRRWFPGRLCVERLRR